ncbi:MAG TPA: ATP-binding protein [Jatrophihabitans sp.]|nr:ATP-binding protein [Jatrophihabitans sp.]
MALTVRRRLAGLGVAAVLLPVLTVIGVELRGALSFAADVPLYLLIVVLTSLVGGFYPALAAAVAASLLLNYYFAPPTYTLTIDQPANIVAVVIFLLIAVLVSRVVDLAAHREAARVVEPLAESDRQRTALLNAVGHDLRTPIAAAKAAVSSLRADVEWSAAQRGELLNTAEDALDRLTGLVTNLLDISRLQVGALPVVPREVGVDDVVARALEYVDPEAKVDVDVPSDLPSVLADAGLLERVVANVLQNALRYAPPDMPVRVAGSAQGDRVELRVIDRGPGIELAQAEAVFRPFQRTSDAAADGAGVGLGLAIARGFTEAMGGTVGAEPTPGGGATVVIALQVAS